MDWMIPTLFWCAAIVLMWYNHRSTTRFRVRILMDQLSLIDKSLMNVPHQHETRIASIKAVWHRIASDREPPEMLAEMNAEDERYGRELASIAEIRDGVIAQLRRLGEFPEEAPREPPAGVAGTTAAQP